MGNLLVITDGEGLVKYRMVEVTGRPASRPARSVVISEASPRPLSLPEATGRALSTWDRPSTWKGVLDRSPCGTGTCAKMAALHAKGQLALNKDFRHEGILGTVFTGRLLRETTVGSYGAVVPTLTGTAWITGFAQYMLDPEDPFPNGFTVGDIWSAQNE